MGINLSLSEYVSDVWKLNTTGPEHLNVILIATEEVVEFKDHSLMSLIHILWNIAEAFTRCACRGLSVLSVTIIWCNTKLFTDFILHG